MPKSSLLLNSFNNSFTDFINDISQLYPLNNDIKKSLKSIELINRLTPNLVIKIWYSNIYKPYQHFIDIGDITFFIDKDYNEDVDTLSNSRDVIEMINKIRQPIRSMSDTNRSHTMEHIQLLSNLSSMYHN